MSELVILSGASRRPAPGPGPIKPTRDQVLDIKGCMISMRDSLDRCMLSWFWPALPRDEQADWFARWHAAGLTHVLMCPVMQYPHNELGLGGSDLSVDWRGEPGKFAVAVADALEQGMVPIVQMTSGDGGTGHDIDQYWSGLLGALHPFAQYCVGSCGFEVAGGGWRSAQISRGVRILAEAGFGAVMLHCQPERATGASYGGEGTQAHTPPGYIWIDYHERARPGIGAYIEDDDPWMGDESGFWKSHGGELIDILYYQTPHGSKLTDPNGAGPGVGAWEDRWREVLERHGIGGRGWRMTRVCMGEMTGLDYFHRGIDDAGRVRIATRARDIAAEYGVKVTFGDGLPA